MSHQIIYFKLNDLIELSTDERNEMSTDIAIVYLYFSIFFVLRDFKVKYRFAIP